VTYPAGRRKAVFRVAGSIAILALLVWALPFGELSSALRRVRPAVWPAAIGTYLLLHIIGVAKWRMLVNAAGAQLPFTAAVRAYYWGLFGNTFLPSIVGGDVVKVGTAMRAARSASGLVMGSLVDRLLDVAGLLMIAGAGAFLSPMALDPASRGAFIGAAIAMAAAGVVALGVLLVFPARRLRFGLRRKLVKVRRALRSTAGNPAVLVAALLLGVALQSALVVLNYWLGIVIGITIPLYVWLFAWPLAKISALVPITQGGIGVREAAIAALLAPFGVSAAKAVASGLVFQAVVIVGGLIGGAAIFIANSRRRDG
jgi:uncharacterized membrane protein YbhN (UPF0104 family)